MNSVRMNRMTIVTLALALCVAGSAIAQTTTVEVKQGEVLSVNGEFLTFRGPEGVKQIQVPADFRFNVEGRQLPLNQLKPGMKLTAVIRTTKTPIEMTSTEVKNATVVHAIGQAIIVRGDDGKHKKFTAKELRKRDVIIYRNGKPVSISDLRKGDKLSATIVTQLPPEILTQTEYDVFAKSQPVRTAQARPAPPRPTRTATQLPKTGGPLPLIGPERRGAPGSRYGGRPHCDASAASRPSE